MTKSKTIAAAITAIALATSLTAFIGQAQAHHWGHHGGWGIGAGIVAGTLIGSAVAANAYNDGYAECHYVKRFDRWGNYMRTVKICDVVPY
jgi:uncharacterized membrane protein YfcA